MSVHEALLPVGSTEEELAYSTNKLSRLIYGDNDQPFEPGKPRKAPKEIDPSTLAVRQKKRPQPVQYYPEEFSWNERLQKILETIATTPEQVKAKCDQIETLSIAFATEAERIVKTLVLEQKLPIDKKTIKPADVGGVAGGIKFITRQMFFKFAVAASADPTKRLYDNDENAAKAAGHELKSLNALISCNIPNLHFPVMALVNAYGFRVVCVSKLPIDGSTLVYGSADAGQHISDSVEVRRMMEKACQILNLKGHYVKEYNLETQEMGKRFIYGPVDIEGHLGYDGRFYVVDTARLFPSMKRLEGVRGCYLFKLFRPEFLKVYALPISSDALTNWQPDSERIENDNLAISATLHLLQVTIPQVAAEWNANPHPRLFSELKECLHQKGIALRFLGLLLHHTTPAMLRERMLIEMAAREFKSILNKAMREIDVRTDSAYRELVLQKLDLLVGNDDESVDFWLNELVPGIRARFYEHVRLLPPPERVRGVMVCDANGYEDDSPPPVPAEGHPVEADPLENLRDQLLPAVASVLRQVSRLSGIVLSDVGWDRLENRRGSGDFTVRPVELVEIRSTIKHMRVIPFIQHATEGGFDETEAYFLKELTNRKQVLGPNHPQVAFIMAHLAELYMENGRVDDSDRLYTEAYDILKEKVGREDDVAFILESHASCLEKYNRLTQAEDIFRKVLDLKTRKFGPEHPEVSSVLTSIASVVGKQGRSAEAHEYYNQALSISGPEGSSRRAIARALNNQAQMLIREGELKQAEGMLCDVLNILETERERGVHHSEYGIVLENLAKVHFLQGLYERATVELEQALAVKSAALGESHTSVAATLDHLGTSLVHRDDLSVPGGPSPGLSCPVPPSVDTVAESTPSPSADATAPVSSNGGAPAALSPSLQAKFARAEDSYQRALQIFSKSLGAGHSSAGVTRNNLGGLFWRKHDTAAAASEFQAACDIFLNSFHDPSHPLYRLAADNSKKLKEQSDYNGAFRAAFHDGYIGFSYERGFELRSIPPEWMQLFRDAGINESDLTDVDTAKSILEIIMRNMQGAAVPAGEQLGDEAASPRSVTYADDTPEELQAKTGHLSLTEASEFPVPSDRQGSSYMAKSSSTHLGDSVNSIVSDASAASGNVASAEGQARPPFLLRRSMSLDSGAQRPIIPPLPVTPAAARPLALSAESEASSRASEPEAAAAAGAFLSKSEPVALKSEAPAETCPFCESRSVIKDSGGDQEKFCFNCGRDVPESLLAPMESFDLEETPAASGSLRSTSEMSDTEESSSSRSFHLDMLEGAPRGRSESRDDSMDDLSGNASRPDEQRSSQLLDDFVAIGTADATSELSKSGPKAGENAVAKPSKHRRTPSGSLFKTLSRSISRGASAIVDSLFGTSPPSKDDSDEVQARPAVRSSKGKSDKRRDKDNGGARAQSLPLPSTQRLAAKNPARVTQPYTASEIDEISLKTGDQVDIVERLPSGYSKVVDLDTGAAGFFPTGFLEEFNALESDWVVPANRPSPQERRPKSANEPVTPTGTRPRASTDEKAALRLWKSDNATEALSPDFSERTRGPVRHSLRPPGPPPPSAPPVGSAPPGGAYPGMAVTPGPPIWGPMPPPGPPPGTHPGYVPFPPPPPPRSVAYGGYPGQFYPQGAVVPPPAPRPPSHTGYPSAPQLAVYSTSLSGAYTGAYAGYSGLGYPQSGPAPPPAPPRVSYSADSDYPGAPHGGHAGYASAPSGPPPLPVPPAPEPRGKAGAKSAKDAKPAKDSKQAKDAKGAAAQPASAAFGPAPAYQQRLSTSGGKAPAAPPPRTPSSVSASSSASAAPHGRPPASPATPAKPLAASAPTPPPARTLAGSFADLVPKPLALSAPPPAPSASASASSSAAPSPTPTPQAMLPPGPVTKRAREATSPAAAASPPPQGSRPGVPSVTPPLPSGLASGPTSPRLDERGQEQRHRLEQELEATAAKSKLMKRKVTGPPAAKAVEPDRGKSAAQEMWASPAARAAELRERRASLAQQPAEDEDDLRLLSASPRSPRSPRDSARSPLSSPRAERSVGFSSDSKQKEASTSRSSLKTSGDKPGSAAPFSGPGPAATLLNTWGIKKRPGDIWTAAKQLGKDIHTVASGTISAAQQKMEEAAKQRAHRRQRSMDARDRFGEGIATNFSATSGRNHPRAKRESAASPAAGGSGRPTPMTQQPSVAALPDLESIPAHQRNNLINQLKEMMIAKRSTNR